MSDTIKALTEAVRGRVITASEPDYDDARAVCNAALGEEGPGAGGVVAEEPARLDGDRLTNSAGELFNLPFPMAAVA